jgi:hypothetical protein
MSRHAFFMDNVPKDTITAFKAACVRKEKTMKEEVLKFMQDYAIRNADPATQPHKFLSKPGHPLLCDVCNKHQSLHAPL